MISGDLYRIIDWTTSADMVQSVWVLEGYEGLCRNILLIKAGMKSFQATTKFRFFRVVDFRKGPNIYMFVESG